MEIMVKHFYDESLKYNTLALRYAELEQKILTSEDEKCCWIEELNWYDHFDADKETAALKIAERKRNSLKRELNKCRAELSDQTTRVADLKQTARLGWDPRYWFSSVRSAKSRELKEQRQTLASVTQHHDELKQRFDIEDEQIVDHQLELENYRGFDKLKADAAVKALSIYLVQMKSNLDQIRPLMEQLDGQLREPLAELMKFKQRKCELETVITRAEAFERRLTNESNGFERKKIHDECSKALGDGSPGNVIRTKRRELETVDRSIGKLEDRLISISKRASRTIKSLVIDGNNLCYQHQNFIGLVALHAVAKNLSRSYPVLIVFDATIRKWLAMNDRDIAASFGDAIKVHVVATKQKADETILDSAMESTTYVISNDRFIDYPDKSAVRDQRVIRHEILNGKVFVHDLGVVEHFPTAG